MEDRQTERERERGREGERRGRRVVRRARVADLVGVNGRGLKGVNIPTEMQ